MEANMERKRHLIGSIFPEKLVFDGLEHRTPRINEAVRLLFNVGAGYSLNENGTSLLILDLPHQVIPLGLEPKTHTLKVYCSTN